MTDRLEYPQLDRAAKEAVDDAMVDLGRRVERLPLHWPDYKITTLDGRVREQRTMADAAEAYRAAVLDLIREEVRRSK